MVGLADVWGWPDLTPRELWIIAQAKTRQKLEIEWGQTSTILAMIHNALAKHPKAPQDFNPLAQDARRGKAAGTPVSFGELKAAILKDRARTERHKKRRPANGSKKRK